MFCFLLRHFTLAVPLDLTRTFINGYWLIKMLGLTLGEEILLVAPYLWSHYDKLQGHFRLEINKDWHVFAADEIFDRLCLNQLQRLLKGATKARSTRSILVVVSRISQTIRTERLAVRLWLAVDHLPQLYFIPFIKIYYKHFIYRIDRKFSFLVIYELLKHSPKCTKSPANTETDVADVVFSVITIAKASCF